MRLRASEIATITGGRLLSGNPQAWLRDLTTDSRTLLFGQCFLALVGEHYNGHDFLEQALERGAWGVIIQQDQESSRPVAKERVPVIAVPDTLRALGDIAAAWRRRFAVPLVAVTGSTGKSTTKEMIARILSGRGPVLKNKGNLNNLVGLPISLLWLRDSHRFAVLELGMNRPGEIARLTEIARPDLGLITNVGPVHLEGLGDEKGVARAKGELVAHLSAAATVAVNLDDPWVGEIMRRHPGPRIGYSRRPEGGAEERESLHLVNFRPVEFQGEAAQFKPLPYGIEFKVQLRNFGKAAGYPVRFELATLGWHGLQNVLAAAAVARGFGIPLEESAARLRDFEGLAGRNQLLKLAGPIYLVNDSYNANPVSMLSALRSFNYWRGRHRGIVVLGDMLELGRFAAEAHRELGDSLGLMDFDLIFLRGGQAEVMAAAAVKAGVPAGRIQVAAGNAEVVARLRAELRPGDWVLVKASRAIRLDEVVAGLQGGRE
jgi:UDP-N-acetylmuramoyl-tripeptide--D-alanyl-D-alanine ligase